MKASLKHVSDLYLMLLDPKGFCARITTSGRLMGFDPGSKRIGVATSDLSYQIATPLLVLQNKKWALLGQEIEALCREHEICGFVVGLPLNMDGTSGPRAQSARDFARNLSSRTALPTCLWDERLSTEAVTRVLIDAGRSRRRRSQLVDKLAAGYILQNFLNWRCNAFPAGSDTVKIGEPTSGV